MDTWVSARTERVPKYWFKRGLFGRVLGRPVTWEGWTVQTIWFVLTLINSGVLEGTDFYGHAQRWLIFLVLSIAFCLITRWTCEP
ncbi:hypothetical protein GCM10007863_01520 [Dyella mobilis]|nr:hypothetical protein GCM10007863_01520 [Dyella mobilis]